MSHHWYNPFVNVKEEGAYNMCEQHTEPFKHYTTALYRCRKSEHRITLPVEMEIEETDIVCLWSEPIPNTSYYRRVCTVLTEGQGEELTPEQRKKFRPRKVHRKTEDTFYVILPMVYLRIPAGHWTHVRLHLTKELNKYYMEFLDLRANKGLHPNDIVFDSSPDDKLLPQPKIRF